MLGEDAQEDTAREEEGNRDKDNGVLVGIHLYPRKQEFLIKKTLSFVPIILYMGVMPQRVCVSLIQRSDQ